MLNPKKRKGSGKGPAGDKLWVNVSAEEAFDPITTVERVPHDPGTHGPVARSVKRHARALRAQLMHLGLSTTPVPMRLRGKRIDRSRLPSLVVRGEPRVLVGREVKRKE